MEFFHPAVLFIFMKNDKKIEALTSHVELLVSLTNTTIDEFKKLESSLKRIEGFSFGTKETANKFEEYITKHKTEIVGLIKEGKLQQQLATVLYSAADNSLKFIKNNSQEADRLFYVRQGEILSLKNKISQLKSLHETTIKEIQKLQEEELEQLVLSDTESSEKSEEIKIRPDKDPHTKIGKSALDIAERRKKSTENSNIQETKSKRGRKKKI